MKTEADHPTIGLLLCQEHNRLVVEYALRAMGNPIGVAQYQFHCGTELDFLYDGLDFDRIH